HPDDDQHRRQHKFLIDHPEISPMNRQIMPAGPRRGKISLRNRRTDRESRLHVGSRSGMGERHETG
ncbi:MAG TPA: hypothetical protein VFP14_12985, partial [Novosphingobium sp.]|nr:hypothetical protein [Novosphingobium sp.]